MRTIVIGDVHGCLDEFRELLKLLSFSKGDDRLVQVGDLMDRGPDPVGCVRLAREMGAIVVLGNHDEKHVRWRKHEARRAAGGKKNPMRPFDSERAAQNAALTDEEIDWISKLPMTYELGDGFVVAHGGMEPKYSFEKQDKAVLRVRYVDETGKFIGYKKNARTPRRLWGSFPGFFNKCPAWLLPVVSKKARMIDQPIGTVRWAEMWKGPESVIYGHAVYDHENPRVDHFPGGACYGIDTGCAYGGPLTAMVMTPGNEPEFAQVHPKKVYYEDVCDEDV